MLMTLALLVLISLISYHPSEEPKGLKIIPVDNAMGVLGVFISYYLIKVFIGYPSIIIPFLFFAWGWNRFRGNDVHRLFRATIFSFTIAIYVSTILGLPQASSPDGANFGFEFSGLVGGFLATLLYKVFGKVGSIVVLISLAMMTLVVATQFSFAKNVGGFIETIANMRSELLQLISRLSKISLPLPQFSSREGRHARKRTHNSRLPFSKPEYDEREDDLPFYEQMQPRVRNEHEIDMNTADQQPATTPDEQKLSVSREVPAVQADQPPVDTLQEQKGAFHDITVTEREDNIHITTDAELPNPLALGDYVFPGLEMLNFPVDQDVSIQKNELLVNARILEERLEEFGIRGSVVEINPGPVITRYEYEPAPGIKLSKITALSDDLALSMRARRIRVIAPIPGKAVVGIELPNREPQMVFLRSILDDDKYRNSTSPLAMGLGKTISGKPFVAELDKMPHLLVAGSTGTGKSVCLNAIIASILYKAHPTEVQFVLIDPKRLELSLYNRLQKHHLTFREDLNEIVVTNPQNALAVLRSLEVEMEQRYEVFAAASVRNIDDFNKKARAGRLKTREGEPQGPIPYIVVVIDELADLMLTAAKEVEEPIARLTQMARAIGIHLIVATQRPSVDVITGVIKANFPARIAFAVASKIDSRTILDMNGAEKLLGKGDMLFLPPGSPEAIRLHGAFVQTEEIEQILDHIQAQPRYPRKLLPVVAEEKSGSGSISNPGQRDELFKDALNLVVRHQQGSISLLQRRLKVGYARAARLVDELEAAGIVGGFDGSKAREVLIDEEQLTHLDPDLL